jgi:hypothetical protein
MFYLFLFLHQGEEEVEEVVAAAHLVAGPFPSAEVTVGFVKELVQGLSTEKEPTVESSVPFGNNECKVLDPERLKTAQQRYQGQVVEIRFKESGKGLAVINTNMDTFDVDAAIWKVVGFLDPAPLEQ